MYQKENAVVITARTNPRIKAVRALHSAKERAQTGLHLIEGDKLVWDALQSGARVQTVFATEGARVPDAVEVVWVDAAVMEALSSVQTPQHLCAVVETPDCSCPAAFPSGLLVVLDCLQDPGNLGTILRTADALGASGVLLSRDSADPFSPKALRAAMGSTYHLPLWTDDLDSALPRLIAQGFTCICGHLCGTESLPKPNPKTALVVGNEGNGVSETTAKLCIPYRMPMRGRAESLNAAIFTALLMKELLDKMG